MFEQYILFKKLLNSLHYRILNNSIHTKLMIFYHLLNIDKIYLTSMECFPKFHHRQISNPRLETKIVNPSQLATSLFVIDNIPRNHVRSRIRNLLRDSSPR